MDMREAYISKMKVVRTHMRNNSTQPLRALQLCAGCTKAIARNYSFERAKDGPFPMLILAPDTLEVCSEAASASPPRTPLRVKVLNPIDLDAMDVADDASNTPRGVSPDLDDDPPVADGTQADLESTQVLDPDCGSLR